MKIRMKTLCAGPQGVLDAGKVYELDPKRAKDLIDGGYAVEVKPEAATEKAVKPGGERADAPANRKAG